MKNYVLLSLLALSQFQQAKLEDPLIELPTGKILGRVDTTAEDVQYYAYEKIPYAAPPVGDLRFKAPQPPLSWEGTLNTTKLDVQCYQLMSMPTVPPMLAQSEDCLFINVFTPIAPGTKPELLPVMLFIHGGGFTMGSAGDTRPDLFINKNVILASINYRLGVFGFLSTQDDFIPGNNGLKDQQMALRWINQNIELFGGDPGRVTIFGQSAGAGSCAYQTLNQDGAGLFQGAILESGTFLSPGMFQRNSRRIAFDVAATIYSSFKGSEDTKALYDLLIKLNAVDLNKAGIEYSTEVTNIWDNFVEVGSLFGPVIEAKNADAFLTKKMYGLVKAGSALPVPIMMGFTSEEKIGMVKANQMESITATLDAHLEYIVSSDMYITDDTARAEMGEKIRAIYTGGEPFADHLGDAIRYSSDNFLTRPMVRHAEFSSKIAPTYFYQFSYDGSFGHTDTHYDGAGTVAHGAELGYLFCSGTSCNSGDSPAEDLLERERLITLWTNFAKYQNPTPDEVDLLQNVTWPAVSTDNGDFHYLDIGEDLEVKNHPKGEAYAEWIKLYDSLGNIEFDSY